MNLYVRPIKFCHQCPAYTEKDRKWFPNGGVMAYKCRRTGKYDAFYHNPPCRTYRSRYAVSWRCLGCALVSLTVLLVLAILLILVY